MKALLHACCAPCLIYPLERLREKAFQVEAFFYNPNIHPFGEYEKRLSAFQDYADLQGVKVDFPPYLPEEFFQAIGQDQLPPQRCNLCWGLRLRKTAQAAKQKGCQAFSSTLLVSPYQDQESLKTIGNQIAKSEGIEFYYEDFRPGFRQAHQQARSQGIYCQKYCGCSFSQEEQCKKSESR